MRIPKLCLAFLALVTCALIRTSFQTLSRPDFYFTLWVVACNAGTCLCVDAYLKRSLKGQLSLPWHMGATALPTLGLAVPLALSSHMVMRDSVWHHYSLIFAAMAIGLLASLCSWQHWALWILAGGTGSHPPRPVIAGEGPSEETVRPGRAWKIRKAVVALCATGLILWTLATDSGPSLYVALGMTVLAAVVIGIATTYFRRINNDTLPEKHYYGETCFGVYSVMTLIPILLHGVLPLEFDHAGTWLALFCSFIAAGPALLALLTGLALDMQKSARKLAEKASTTDAPNSSTPTQ